MNNIFNEILVYLTRNGIIQINTLGNRARISISENGDFIHLTYANNQDFDIKEEHFNVIYSRYLQLEVTNEHETTSMYNYPNFDGPNLIVDPYIPAIIRWYLNDIQP